MNSNAYSNLNAGETIACDKSGNMYVAGEYDSTFVLDTFTLTDPGVPYSNIFISKFNDATAGIATVGVAREEIRLYPDPVSRTLTVAAPYHINNVIIYNMAGQILYSRECNSEKIEVDVSGLAAGIFFVKVNNTIVRKFVKE